MNGLIGRRVEVVVVELGSDIYLCSEFRINCAEARERDWNEGMSLFV